MVFLGVALFFGSFVRGQNISLVGSYHPSQTGFGDVWGNGNIACMGVWLSTGYGSGWGFGIFDISNPASPQLLTTYNYGSSVGNRFEQGVIRSNILYVGSWGGSGNGSGCHILSITNPASPVLLSRITKSTAGTATNGFSDVHTLWVDRNFIFLAAHNPGIVSIKVFDISNPAAPTYVRDIVTTNTTKVHQMTVGHKGTNTILYTSGWGGANDSNLSSYGQTDIWDVSSMSTTQAPKWLGRIYSGYNSHSSWPTPDGNTLVVNRETPGGEVSFYDISTPPNPSPSATPNPAPYMVISPASMGIEGDIPHNPVIISNLLYLSWYQNGLQIFDITDKTKPVRIGSYDTYPGVGVTNTYNGNWGIYPHLGINKLLVSDINTGFYILDGSPAPTATNNYPPFLVKSPVSQTVTQGDTTTFNGLVTGSSMNYRWYFNGQPIAGATSSSLIISNTLSSQSGSYSFVASNTLQSVTRAVTSSVATLSVSLPTNGPVITSQPQNTTVYPGQNATFSVAVLGTAPFTFQWRLNGHDIQDATNNPFVVQGVQGDSVGNYSVLVTDAISYTASSNASLALMDSPYISAVQATPGGRGAIISWKTTVPSDSQVQFDQATASRSEQMAAGSSSASFSQGSYTDTTLTTNHSILLTGLTPATTYNFQAVSSNDTNSYISGVYSFATAGGDIIVDNPAATYTGGVWTYNATLSTDKYLTDYNYAFASNSATATATFRPNIPVPGKYDVYVWYPQGGNRCTNAPYLISYDGGGQQTVLVNQQINGGGWRLIGSALPFAAGTSGYVRISNNAKGGTVVMADAVRFVYTDSQDIPTDGSIPAWWSSYYFGNTTTNPNADADGDGISNAQEYILGTSPTSPNQNLSVKVFRSGDSANVIFSPYLADRSYTLLHSSDLSPNWTPANAGTIIPDSYGEGVFSLSVTNPTLDFFRLSVQLNAGGASRGLTTYSGTVSLTEETALSPYATDPVCGPNRAYVRSRAAQ